jgi:hypothetical protein
MAAISIAGVLATPELVRFNIGAEQLRRDTEVWSTSETALQLDLRSSALEQVLQAYVAHYVEARPHRGLSLAVPLVTEHRRPGDYPNAGSKEGRCWAV